MIDPANQRGRLLLHPENSVNVASQNFWLHYRSTWNMHNFLSQHCIWMLCSIISLAVSYLTRPIWISILAIYRHGRFYTLYRIDLLNAGVDFIGSSVTKHTKLILCSSGCKFYCFYPTIHFDEACIAYFLMRPLNCGTIERPGDLTAVRLTARSSRRQQPKKILFRYSFLELQESRSLLGAIATATFTLKC